MIDIPETAEPVGAPAPVAALEEAISKRAYQLWLERGCPEGSPEEDWYRATSELTSREQSAVGEESGRT